MSESSPMPSGMDVAATLGLQLGDKIKRIAELEAELERLRDAAEDVYSPWSCGEPLDREMRELGRALGMTIDPA